MALQPLGTRYSRQKAGERRVVLKPAVESYLINVRLPTFIIDELLRRQLDPTYVAPRDAAAEPLPWRAAGGDDKSQLNSSAANVTVVRVPAAATAYEAIAHILNHVDYRERAVEEFMLAQCFADFSINFALRGLFGDNAPIRLAMEFPYYLSLVVSPYVLKQRAVLESDEPEGRHRIVQEQRAFHVFSVEYFAILARLHGHYEFLIVRELDSRQTRKLQERRAYFDLAEVQLFRAERAARSRLCAEENTHWAVRSYSSRSVIEHLLIQQRFLAELVAFAEEAQRALQWRTRDYWWLLMLRSRFDSEIVAAFATLLDDGVAYRRALYTDSRIQATLRGARETSLTPETFHQRRVEVGRERHRALYSAKPEVAHEAIINHDVFSNSRVVLQ